MDKVHKIINTLFMYIVLAFVLFVSSIDSAYAFPEGNTIRIFGADRYKTAAEISRQGWKSSDYVILATGDGDDKFADALAGTPLSKVYDAPVLLTNTDELNIDTLSEITQLGSKNIIILGGTGVISENVVDNLIAMDKEVIRLFGDDRYATAAKIARELKKIKPFTKAVLTSGREFQYSMMAAPFAAANGTPILFTDRNSLPCTTKSALKDLSIEDVEIIGNRDVVSAEVETAVRNLGIRVERSEGSTMQQTNINIIKKYCKNADGMILARDDLFADALVGASFAAKYNYPIFLVGQELVSADIYNYITGLNTKENYILGGPGAVSDGVVNMLIPGTIHKSGIRTNDYVAENIMANIRLDWGNTPGNISNLGIAAAGGEWIYFRNINDNGYLYKSKIDGSEMTRLCDDKPFFINVSEDWVYYVSQNNDNHLYKIRTNGKDKLKIINDEANCLTVSGEWAYYVNNGDWGLYKIRTDGAGKTKIIDESVRSINPRNDWIYCCVPSDENKIYKIKTDADEQQIVPVDNAFNVMVDGEWIYYQDSRDGYRMHKVNAFEPQIDTAITGDEVFSMNVTGDWIYYINRSDGNRIYKVRMDGSSRTRLNNCCSIFINVAGDWVYYINSSKGNKMYRVRIDGTQDQEVGIQK